MWWWWEEGVEVGVERQRKRRVLLAVMVMGEGFTLRLYAGMFLYSCEHLGFDFGIPYDRSIFT